jgi:hypothetical protein
MSRKCAVIGVVPLAGIAIAILAAAFWPRGPGPDPATFVQVQPGMTVVQISRLVGAPPGNYSTRPVDFTEKDECGLIESEVWITDSESLVVYPDGNGPVWAVKIVPMRQLPDNRTPLQRLRARLGL